MPKQPSWLMGHAAKPFTYTQNTFLIQLQCRSWWCCSLVSHGRTIFPFFGRQGYTWYKHLFVILAFLITVLCDSNPESTVHVFLHYPGGRTEASYYNHWYDIVIILNLGLHLWYHTHACDITMTSIPMKPCIRGKQDDNYSTAQL